MLNLLQPIAGLAGQWMANRAEKAKAKQALAVAKIEAKTKKVQSDADWEEQAMSASQDSWKDEAWTILFIAIIAMCFIPPLQPYVDRGFGVLATTPDWFQWAMYASIAASFGLRGIKGLKK